MLVPEPEQGARDRHGLPARQTGRCWITPGAVSVSSVSLPLRSNIGGPVVEPRWRREDACT
jgi:hypothetical protein